jgi:integrase
MAGLYPLVMLALFTGARRGELLTLKWSDVDSKAGRAIRCGTLFAASQ